MIQSQLASFLGRNDELPNIELAKKIIENEDAQSIKELIQLCSGKNKHYQNDSIKVLYEVGHLKPILIKPFLEDFISLLNSKNNRLQWGALTALHAITKEYYSLIIPYLDILQTKAMEGSVITRDNFMAILNILIKTKENQALTYPYLEIQLLTCPNNQLPMYAEWIQANLDKTYADKVIQILNKRLPELEKESKKKRLLKVINKLKNSLTT